jgi:cell division protease FtsH
MTKQQALARISMAFGGRVAEEVVFGEVTTGAQDDIKRATRFARSMVCEHGMSQKLGPIAYGDPDENVFLGREIATRRDDFSDETAREIDREVRSIVEAQYATAKRVIQENRDKLNRLAEALLERETLDSEEIQAAMEGKELPARDPVVIPMWRDKQKASEEPKRPSSSIFGEPKAAPSA